jgi:hypothetical protein
MQLRFFRHGYRCIPFRPKSVQILSIAKSWIAAYPEVGGLSVHVFSETALRGVVFQVRPREELATPAQIDIDLQRFRNEV